MKKARPTSRWPQPRQHWRTAHLSLRISTRSFLRPTRPKSSRRILRPYVQARLGVGHIPCYDLAGSGCAGFVLALDIARSRALADGRRMLVIGVELITRLMNWKDRNTCVLFGDAAGAAVVGSGRRRHRDPGRHRGNRWRQKRHSGAGDWRHASARHHGARSAGAPQEPRDGRTRGLPRGRPPDERGVAASARQGWTSPWTTWRSSYPIRRTCAS